MKHNGDKLKQNAQWRLSLLRIFLSLFAVAIVVRLFALQVQQYDSYAALASVRHDVSSILTPERGSILVRDSGDEEKTSGGYSPVAANKKVENLAVSPYDVSDDAEVAGILANISGLEASKIQEILAQKEKKYTLLKKDLTEAEITAVAEAKKRKSLPASGVWLEAEIKRYYPEGEFLSHALGFLAFSGDDREGRYGLEKFFEELLAGSAGKLEDARGGSTLDGFRKLVPAKNGSNLVLTIDRSIQNEVQRVLKDYVDRFSADGGTAIVVDPKNGNVLAMANEPSFNVNEFNKVEQVSIFSNSALQARYEPGSVLKPITMASALDAGKVRPDDTYTDTGRVVVDGHVIQNSDLKSNRLQNTNQVLEKWLNTGMVYVSKQMGKDTMERYFKKFGLDEKTGISLPGEIVGDLCNLNTKSDIAFATAAFGQGVSVTPVELVQAYTAIASGGEMKKLNIISEIQHADGSREVVEPQAVRRVISVISAAEVGAMLVNVVENGHGRRAKVSGYYIAGKTGTAQVPLTDARGYDPDKTIGSFIGFGPVENPAFLALVKIDNPQGVKFAESTAAPAFGEIAKFILNYQQIPPTRTLD